MLILFKYMKSVHMHDKNHTFDNNKVNKNCSNGNFISAELPGQKTRSHYISIRLNDAELSYVDGLREHLNRTAFYTAIFRLPVRFEEILTCPSMSLTGLSEGLVVLTLISVRAISYTIIGWYMFKELSRREQTKPSQKPA